MCGGKPQAPQIIYQGPSQEDLARSQASLDLYRTQMNDQQTAFRAQLQQQIDAANAETATIRTRYEKELADGKAAADAASKGFAESTAARSAAFAAESQAAFAASAKSAAEAFSKASSTEALTQQIGSYAVTASQSAAAPTNTQTTAAVTKKEKPNKNLKISTAGTASGAGTGLNIGV